MRHELLISAGLVLVSDFLSKAVVTSRLAEGQSVRLGWWLKFRHVANKGRSEQTPQRLLSSVCVLGAAICGIYFVMKQGYYLQRPVARPISGGKSRTQ